MSAPEPADPSLQTTPTMKPNILHIQVLLLLPSSFCLAQGPLTPPGAPAPTQKSLQEIWDKVGILQTQLTTAQADITTLKSDNATLKAQLYSVSSMDAISAAGLALPWILTTVDSGGSVGEYTSLAFGPDGQPAISYRDVSNLDLKFARKGIFKPVP